MCLSYSWRQARRFRVPLAPKGGSPVIVVAVFAKLPKSTGVWVLEDEYRSARTRMRRSHSSEILTAAGLSPEFILWTMNTAHVRVHLPRSRGSPKNTFCGFASAPCPHDLQSVLFDRILLILFSVFFPAWGSTINLCTLGHDRNLETMWLVHLFIKQCGFFGVCPKTKWIPTAPKQNVTLDINSFIHTPVELPPPPVRSLSSTTTQKLKTGYL